MKIRQPRRLLFETFYHLQSPAVEHLGLELTKNISLADLALAFLTPGPARTGRDEGNGVALFFITFSAANLSRQTVTVTAALQLSEGQREVTAVSQYDYFHISVVVMRPGVVVSHSNLIVRRQISANHTVSLSVARELFCVAVAVLQLRTAINLCWSGHHTYVML